MTLTVRILPFIIKVLNQEDSGFCQPHEQLRQFLVNGDKVSQLTYAAIRKKPSSLLSRFRRHQVGIYCIVLVNKKSVNDGNRGSRWRMVMAFNDEGMSTHRISKANTCDDYGILCT